MPLTCHTCGTTFRGKKALTECVGSHGKIQVAKPEPEPAAK
jgi:hypothetical protein